MCCYYSSIWITLIGEKKKKKKAVKLWFCLMAAKYLQGKQIYDVLNFQLALPVITLKKTLKRMVLEIAKFEMKCGIRSA